MILNGQRPSCKKEEIKRINKIKQEKMVNFDYDNQRKHKRT